MLKTFCYFLNQKMDRNLYVLTFLFFVVFTFFLLSSVLRTNAFYQDSENYFTLPTKFFVGTDPASFRITNYDNGLRGYVLPLMLLPSQVISKVNGRNDVFFYNIFASSIHPFFIIIVLPLLIKEIFRKEIKLYMVIAFYSMIMFFWHGLVIFPLSDLWVIYFLCSALLLIKIQKFGLAGKIIAGVSLGLACNVRPIYLCILPLVLIYPFTLKTGINRQIINVAALIVGVFLAWVPQIMINKTHFDTYSPLLQTHIQYKGGLYLTQLNYGFTIERFETNMSNPPIDQAVKFYNKRALSIIEKENLLKEKPFENYGSVFTLFAKYPIDFISIYSSHIFNGLDNRYPEIYIFDFYTNRWILYFLNFTVIFTALFLLSINYKNVFTSWENILLLSIFALPAAMVIPTQLETRFFLPLHLLFYTTCCFCSYPTHLFSKKQNYYLPAFLLLFYVSFISLCFYISSLTTV